MNCQHDLKTGGKIAHKAKFKGPGFTDGDRWESITTDKDHEQKYWYSVPGMEKNDTAVKVQAKMGADGKQMGAVAVMAGGYSMGEMKLFSHM